MLRWFRRSSPAMPTGEDVAASVDPLIDYLVSQISTPARASSVLGRVAEYRVLPPSEQEQALPALYLLLEEYLVEIDSMRKLTREQLRKLVRSQYPPALQLESLDLVFQEPQRQEVLLCRGLLDTLLRRAHALLGDASALSLASAREWLSGVPHAATLPIPLDLPDALPRRDEEWVPLLGKLSIRLHTQLQRMLGARTAARIFEDSYVELAEAYAALETFPVVIGLLPDKLIDERKIHLLSRSQMQRVLLEKVDELQRINEQIAAKNRELERAQNELESAKAALERTVVERTTELQDASEQLRQAQKMEAIGRLAGGVAHDFNNLLTVINGYSEILRRQLPHTDVRRTYVDEIGRAGENAATLVDQLLAFSRRQVLAPEVLDFNAVLSDMDKMLRRLIGEDVDLVMVLAPALGRVKADPGQLQQVIMNLAVNSRDAMPHGGKLTIETANLELDEAYAHQRGATSPGSYVLLAVSDTGHGMDAATQTQIFEPFFTTKEQGKGTGLGLSTVYGIVKQSGGHVWVYSETGHGTTFKICLPRITDGLEPVAPATESREAPSGTETILLIEDEDQLRRLMHATLQGNGYSVLGASRGEEALRLSERHAGPVDLLVTDVIMPGMSGREVADRLAVQRPTMRVLYVSGYTDGAIVHHGVLEPGVNLLQKPFTPSVLAERVRQVLDAPRGV